MSEHPVRFYVPGKHTTARFSGHYQFAIRIYVFAIFSNFINNNNYTDLGQLTLKKYVQVRNRIENPEKTSTF